MKNIATGDVLERIRRLAPSHVTAPFKTVAEWREWQLSEGQKRCEEINRQNRQLRVEKILNRSGIQPLHRKCSFSNYQVQNEGQRYALSQAKSIADELMTGCTNFAFSGKPGTGKNHLAAAIGNRLLKDGQTVIVVVELVPLSGRETLRALEAKTGASRYYISTLARELVASGDVYNSGYGLFPSEQARKDWQNARKKLSRAKVKKPSVVDPDLIWSLPDGEIRRYDRRLNIICRECRKSEVMQRVLAFYQNGFRERLGDQG
ncbi:DUF977 family protein [Escherichia coli]|nr:DUF977 family protein [Escherichia coli]